MATKEFNAKQKEIVARKMGYDGPMQMFDNFLRSDPAMARKYGIVVDKYMAKGGVVKKYQEGGLTLNKDTFTPIEGPTNRGSVRSDDPYFQSPEYKALQERMGSGPQIGTMDIYDSPYFGRFGSGSIGRQQDEAYKQYLARISATPPASTQLPVLAPPPQGNPMLSFDDGVGSGQQYRWIGGVGSEVYTPIDAQGNPIGAAFGPGYMPPSQGPVNISLPQDPRTLPSGPDIGPIETQPVRGGVSFPTAAPATTAATAAPEAGLTPVSQTVSQAPPPAPATPVITPAENVLQQQQLMATQLAPTQAATAAPAAAATTTTAAAPTPTTAATYQAATAAPEVAQTLAGVKPAEGTVSQQAQVQAATMEPTSTAISGLQAAEGVATQITGAPIRKVQTEELISGPAVNMDTVEQTLQKAEAAQGVVTEDMTVQGQLAKLTAGFEANNPPSWAAASLRGVTAVMAQRGLGASSLAGQAMIQATLEAALPIANADAQAYQQMGLQNLSNRQQVAVLAAQQRAQFLGQEFDQGFQTRVVNASRIADIANVNFNAQQQIVLENARLAQTMDMANLGNRQALVMASAAQIASLEAQNLNNRQQTAVVNAQAFLQMDMANLSNAQQTELFKAQSNVQALLSDQAADNAALQFNATSENQVQQFYDTLVTQVGQFNATQNNSMAQFNTDQYNALQRFNSEQQNARDQFNAQNRLVIDQSNAQWRREISTANTAATNRANEVNAQAALQVGLSEYNNEMQIYRDNIQYAFTSGENARNRENYVAIAVLQKEATVTAAKLALEGKLYEALGNVSAKVMEKTTVVADGVKAISGVGSSLWQSVVSAIGGSAGGSVEFENKSLPGDDAYGWKYYKDPVSNDVTTVISPDGVYYDGVGNEIWNPNDLETNDFVPDFDTSWMTDSNDYYSGADDYFYWDYT